jgi:choline kinase
MATLTAVPVSLPDDKVPTKKDVKDILSIFLTQEWPSTDPDTLKISYHASFANAHIHVERPLPESGTPREPLKVFIKIHNEGGGDIDVFKHLVPSKQDEARLCEEYGRSGLGAKVYGFFQTQDGTVGRIDEFLDARNLEPEDVEDAAIRSDVAKGLATFHSMTTALRKSPVEAYYDAVIGGLNKYHKKDRLKTLAKEGGVDMTCLVDYDFASRLRKVVAKLESIGAKTGWCIHDVQFMNILVKNNNNNNRPQQDESRVVLIDFEFVMRNYRAFDIGGHYMQKLFNWFDEENKIANCRPYSEEEKRHFCAEYAVRWTEITGDADTGDQVFLEAEYGYLLAITFDIHNMLCFMDIEGDKDPLNLLGLNKLFEEFMAQYKALGLGD